MITRHYPIPWKVVEMPDKLLAECPECGMPAEFDRKYGPKGPTLELEVKCLAGHTNSVTQIRPYRGARG
jgi:hypothetical protein